MVNSKDKMKITDRLYWFARNLAAFILQTICVPFFVLYMWIRSIQTLFITDGSELLGFPWETDWSWNGK